MKFLQHVYFAILECAYFMTLKFHDFAKILYFDHFNLVFSSNTHTIHFLGSVIKHVLEFSKPTLSKVQ